MSQAVFLTIEGIEGVGKSTNIAFIQQWFAQQELALRCTREPGGTPFAEKIRDLVLSPAPDDEPLEPISDDAELLLIFAARAQHIQQVIQPSLSQGVSVLCDRFTDSTYAYQGSGRGLGKAKVEQLESFVQGDMRPDVVLILDVPVEVSQARVSQRQADINEDKDRFEQEKTEFFERVRQAYLDRAARYPERYFVIDATQALEAVQSDIAAVLESLKLV